MKADQQRISDALKEVFPERLELGYLFGSFATGHATANSDIDLAILPTDPLPKLEIWERAQKLAKILGRDVDLIDLMNCTTVLRSQIVREGVLLLDTNGLAPFFETDTYRMYQDMQLSRQDNINSFVGRLKGSAFLGNQH